MPSGVPITCMCRNATNAVCSFVCSAARQRIHASVCLAVLIAIPFTGCDRRPYRAGKVVGSSMSPNILGDHYFVECVECGFPYTCDVEQANKREFLVCANCGGNTDRSKSELRPADSVKVDMSGSSINRWDVVAFRLEAGMNQNRTQIDGIKRVIGLPGEKIAFRGGNLFVNEKVVRKTKDQQRKMMVSLHDTKFRPADNRNWIYPDGSGWNIDRVIRFVPQNGRPSIQWISFRNRRNYAHAHSISNFGDTFPFEDFLRVQPIFES